MTKSEYFLDLSFIILTWNSNKYIKRCLDSIMSSLNPSEIEYEILIVDNGSKDSTPSILKEFQNRFTDKIHLEFLSKNYGTTYSRNIAIKKARGEFLCILDSDVEIHPGVIEHLIGKLKDDPLTALAAPRLLYENKRYQKTTDYFPTITRKIYRYFFLRLIEIKEEKTEKLKTSYPVDYAISAFWVLKKNVIEKIGYLDENIFYSPEDVDFCLRIWKAGLRVIYAPAVSSIHHTQEISRGVRLNRALFHHIVGLFYYFMKHGYFLKKPEF